MNSFLSFSLSLLTKIKNIYHENNRKPFTNDKREIIKLKVHDIYKAMRTI
jgi:hypothetical protein